MARVGIRTLATAAAASFAVLLATLTTEVRAQQPESTGCTKAAGHTVCRTDPRGGTDASIVRELVHQIDGTGGGDTVRAAVYQWTLHDSVRPVADSLVQAKRRGVDVKLVIGQRSAMPAQNDPAIAKFRSAGIGVVQCEGACLPSPSGRAKGPDHNRFFLIEHGTTPTVVTTSLNLTGFQVTQAHNLLGVHGDRVLYDFYRAYWHRLYHGSWKGWDESDKSGSGENTRAWVFPRSNDPVASQLRRVTGCRDGDRVWVAHAHFQSNRPAVREQLERIDRLGCDVRVLVHENDTNEPSWIGRKIGGDSVRVHGSLRDKFILLDAEFDGRDRRFVYAGTHNLSGNNLNNADDNMLRVRSDAVADVY